MHSQRQNPFMWPSSRPTNPYGSPEELERSTRLPDPQFLDWFGSSNNPSIRLFQSFTCPQNHILIRQHLSTQFPKLGQKPFRKRLLLPKQQRNSFWYGSAAETNPETVSETVSGSDTKPETVSETCFTAETTQTPFRKRFLQQKQCQNPFRQRFGA